MFFDGDINGKKILVHACCGPCSLGAVPRLLDEGGRVTLFFYNPCIEDGEFERRLDALNVVAAHYGLDVIVPDHDYAAFLSYARGHASAPEGGARCALCLDDRISASARYAAKHGYDMYTTTLTVSPHKNSKLIFSLAAAVTDGAPFLARDFKKRDGFKQSCALSAELGIYRQRFCGCEFSSGERVDS